MNTAISLRTRKEITRSLLVVLIPLVLPLLAHGQDARPYGIDQRVAWTTSRIHGTPDPPLPYRTQRAFPGLTFQEPLAMTAAASSDRLFVAERYGKVYSFPNQPDVQQADLLLDLGKVIYGLAVHPKFSENGFVYVTYIDPDEGEVPEGTRLARFQASTAEVPRCDPASEHIILRWPSGGHNGGCLKFGPDGYLYVATGDSSGIADELQTGQDISKLSGAILRIDVDRPGKDRAYTVPADNPFVDVDGARAEIWAYGLRQPWKFSFDRETGDLWTGNVGQDLWEQVFLIQRGGNYGWSVMEGNHAFRPGRPRGPTQFVPPIVEHDHAEFRSITGGFVYQGSRLAELRGAYIYGDYDTGKIWMLRYDRDSAEVTEHRELVDSTLRLVGFGQDNAGELYLVDHMGGRLSQLAANPAVNNPQSFPRRLSETGLFTSVPDHQLADGVIPYSVTAPQWCDGASKQRFLALPGDAKIEFDGITYPQPAPGAPHGWKFPDGTVAFETISLEMEIGNAGSRKRLETRVLHYEKLTGSEDVGDQYWRGYTYVWNDEQTDATLLDGPHGMDRPLVIQDPHAPGGQRRQTWHFPSRAECTVCHNMAAKYALGINTLQINRLHNYGDVVDNQLRTFDHLGLFTEPLPKPPAELPKLVDYRDSAEDTNLRARSYLHANCSHCHRKWGGGNADFLLLSSVGLPEMGISDVRPGHGSFYIPAARILSPGAPEHSVLFYRLAKLGPGHMPRIGASVVDEDGLSLIYDWIASLDASRSPAEGGPLGLEKLGNDERAAAIDRLLATTSDAIRLMRYVDGTRLPGSLRAEVITRATSHPASQVRDLFERFLPEEKRTQRLGAVIQPAKILAMQGDAARGRQLFFDAAGVQCRNCHKISGRGTEVGPDLSQIGKKYSRAKLLDNILNPSREIEPKYVVHLAQTDNGNVHIGLVVKRDAQEVVLKDAKNTLVRLSVDRIEQLAPQQQSLMPDLLLRDMTAEQVADLTAFLSSLK